LNEKIRLYLNEIYGPFGYSYGKNFDEDINVDGMVINTQYINKMVNNYMTFGARKNAQRHRTTLLCQW
jgi:hypothetical protein